jgi:lipopolysaccharide/colanic/teichoic acid biosynthesis glycosyltransferase
MDTVYSPAICTQPGIYSREQFQMALEREKARAERNGHSVSLAIIQTSGRRTRERPRLEDVLRGRLRIMDEAGWFDQSRIGVLMPYTSRQGAWHMIEDMCRLMQGALSPSDCRVYTYPQDWLTGRGAEDVQEVAHTREVQPVGSVAEHPRATSPLHDDPVSGGPADMPAWQRGLDITGALFGLMVLSPVFLATALVIKLVSPGPVFFKQVRIGRGGKPFLLWKFRTMTAGADTAIHQNHVAQLIRSANGAAAARPMAKLDDDPRVIPLGRIIRGACIDELPQLINVLRGEMSLVGPRPPIPYEVREYLPWQRRRFDTMPGLTGLWQVSGKNRLTFDEMIRLDIRYCRTKCLWKAVAIICRTPLAIAQEIGEARVRWKLQRMGVSHNG